MTYSNILQCDTLNSIVIRSAALWDLTTMSTSEMGATCSARTTEVDSKIT